MALDDQVDGDDGLPLSSSELPHITPSGTPFDGLNEDQKFEIISQQEEDDKDRDWRDIVNAFELYAINVALVKIYELAHENGLKEIRNEIYQSDIAKLFKDYTNEVRKKGIVQKGVTELETRIKELQGKNLALLNELDRVYVGPKTVREMVTRCFERLLNPDTYANIARAVYDVFTKWNKKIR